MLSSVVVRNSVQVELDRVRRLYYGMNALCAFEDAMGRTLADFFGEISARSQEDPDAIAKVVGLKTLRTLVWCGLIEEDPSLTPSRVGELIDGAPGDSMSARVIYVFQKAMEAFARSQEPDSKKKAQTQADHRGGDRVEEAVGLEKSAFDGVRVPGPDTR